MAITLDGGNFLSQSGLPQTGLASAGASAAEQAQAAEQSSSDGAALLQAADGRPGSIDDNLQRLRQLALRTSNGALNPADRATLDAPTRQLTEEIDRILTASHLGRGGTTAIPPIPDSDTAREVAEKARHHLLQDAGLAIQVQANLRSELVLRLLKIS